MSGLNADFEPLFSLLDMQMKANQQLLSLAEEQRQSIIKNEVEKLDSLIRRQSTQLRRLAALEKKRLEYTTHLQVELDLQDQFLTLNDLLPYAPSGQRQSLQNQLDEFAALLFKLKEVNDTNKLLLQTNIEFNEFMLNLLADNVDPLNNLYCEDGNKAGEGPFGPSLFDHQV